MVDGLWSGGDGRSVTNRHVHETATSQVQFDTGITARSARSHQTLLSFLHNNYIFRGETLPCHPTVPTFAVKTLSPGNRASATPIRLSRYWIRASPDTG